MKPLRKGYITSLALVAAVTGCTTTQSVEVSPSFRKVTAKHNTATPAVTVARTQRYTTGGGARIVRSDLATGDTIKIYDMGRSVDANGNLVEAHKVYTKVEDGHWNLGVLFGDGWRQDGGVNPPTYHKRPASDELTDAINRANAAEQEALAAKKKIDDVAALISQRAQVDNDASRQLASVIEENQRLKAQLAQQQLNAAFSSKAQAQPVATERMGNNAEPVFQDPGDSPLSQWGKRIDGGKGSN
jgi:hypothetical protein